MNELQRTRAAAAAAPTSWGLNSDAIKRLWPTFKGFYKEKTDSYSAFRRSDAAEQREEILT